MSLVTVADLRNYLGRPTLRDDTAAVAIQVAEGWIRGVAPALESPEWPDPPPLDLWSWAVELAALAYDNPTTLTARTVGGVSEAYHVARRQEILDAIKERYGGPDGTGALGSPRGCFPAPSPWPDSAERVAYGRRAW